MNQKEVISGKQFFTLIYVFSIGSAVLVVPTVLLAVARNTAWVCAIIGTGSGLLFAGLLLGLIKKYPQSTLIDIAKKSCGKYVGGTISVLYLLVMLLEGSFLLRDISNFMTTQIVPETYSSWIHILIMIAVMYAAYLGIEVVGRTSEIFLPWVLVPFVLLIILNIPQMKIEHMLPLFYLKADEIYIGSLYFLSNPFLELILILMVTPHVQKYEHVKKGLLYGVVASGFTIIIVTLSCILVLGANIASMYLYPTYLLGKMISIGQTIQHIEVLVAIIWMLSIFFKITIVFYALRKGLGQLLNLNNTNFLNYPIGLILSAAAYYIIPNTTYFGYFVQNYWPYYLFILSVLIPCIFLVIGIFKRRSVTTQ
ncbi:GerAB/ArcD/ProY family transporter [Priestia flexa]|uniref:GerAB/ArcD/ProY family transporter n=1 Tax=Priestia flexa TaxID=86664 RepID=UPI001B32E0CB|nr:endospore germination permease [Priestia flexa]